jgi:hypothetical protein
MEDRPRFSEQALRKARRTLPALRSPPSRLPPSAPAAACGGPFDLLTLRRTGLATPVVARSERRPHEGIVNAVVIDRDGHTMLATPSAPNTRSGSEKPGAWPWSALEQKSL